MICTVVGGTLAAGRRQRAQHGLRPGHRREDGTDQEPTARDRGGDASGRSRLRTRCSRSSRSAFVVDRELAFGCSCARSRRVLLRCVHDMAQAVDPSEHRDRRRCGCRSRIGRMDCSHRSSNDRTAPALLHHLPVDAATLLGTGSAYRDDYRAAEVPMSAGGCRAVDGDPPDLVLRRCGRGALLVPPGGRERRAHLHRRDCGCRSLLPRLLPWPSSANPRRLGPCASSGFRSPIWRWSSCPWEWTRSSVTPDEQGAGSAPTPRAQGSTEGSRDERRRARGSERVFKLVALVAGLLLVAFVVVIVARGSPRSPEVTFPTSVPPSLAVGSPAPSFTLERMGGGAPVSLSTFHGTPVVLSFFASWCPHCREDLSAFAAIAHSSAGRVQVIGVDSNDGDGSAAQRLLPTAQDRTTRSASIPTPRWLSSTASWPCR